MRTRNSSRRTSAPIAAIGIVALLFVAAAAPAAAAGRPSADAAITALERAVPFAGTAWGIDARTNQVIVSVDSSVSGARLAAVKSTVRGLGSAARLEVVAGVFRTDAVIGGDAIYGSKYRCSLGFNVVKAGVYYFLTAGHCGKPEKTWWTSANHSTLVGSTVGYSFPGNDYALVRYDNASLTHPGGFTAGNAFVGESVTRRGSTTGTHTGTVTALNVSVRYQGAGRVDGMIQTTACAEPGDSGGAMYDGTKALGITSGGSGDCRTGGVTFFQPVTEAATAYGVTVY